MLKLTKRQQQVLDIIKDSMRDRGMPPTRAEIAKILGFKSVNAAEDHLKALAKKVPLKFYPVLLGVYALCNLNKKAFLS